MIEVVFIRIKLILQFQFERTYFLKPIFQLSMKINYLCEMTFISHDVMDLPKIVTDILPNIKHDIVLFKGEMGAGKTTIIKEFLHQLGSEDNISSPTYSLVNEYKTPKGSVFHFDFYRINNEEEAYDMGWEEYADSGNLCLVEWPERIENLIPENYHTLEILNQNNVRTISFN